MTTFGIPSPRVGAAPRAVAMLVAILAPAICAAQRSTLDADVRALGMDREGHVFPAVKITVEEFRKFTEHPLLPFVFFEPGSAEIPERYHRVDGAVRDSFEEARLYHLGTLDVYHHVLNIIGKRLRDSPDESVTLVGCNDNVDNEAGNVDLSKRRALAVRAYLHNVWGIDESRLAVTAQNLPDSASDNAGFDGQEENRRVEIRPNSTDATLNLLNVVKATDTIRTSNPPLVRFQTLCSGAPEGWQLIAFQKSRPHQLLFRRPQAATAGRPPANIDWDLEKDQANIPRSNEPLEYTLSLEAPNESPISQAGPPLRIEQYTIRKKIEEGRKDTVYRHFSLILFPFNSAALDSMNKHILTDMQKRIADAFSVEVTGYADRTGDPDRNRALSEERAENAAKFMHVRDAVLRIDPRGFDPMAKPELTQTLPEGRFYSRTVDVEAKVMKKLTEED